MLISISINIFMLILTSIKLINKINGLISCLVSFRTLGKWCMTKRIKQNFRVILYPLRPWKANLCMAASGGDGSPLPPAPSEIKGRGVRTPVFLQSHYSKGFWPETGHLWPPTGQAGKNDDEPKEPCFNFRQQCFKQILNFEDWKILEEIYEKKNFEWKFLFHFQPSYVILLYF